MPNRPEISVLLPAYRAQPFVARAVRSVVAQSFGDWEIVIAADDGADYLAHLAAEGVSDPRIRQVSTRTRRSGTANARNAALEAAAGRFLTPLDADDMFLPDRLEILVPIARADGAVVDNVRASEEGSGASLGCFIPPDEALERLTADRFFKTSIPAKPLVSAALGLRWDPDTGLSDDVLYVAQLLDRLGPLRFERTPLQEYRVVDGSLCHNDDSTSKAERGYRRLLERLAGGTLAITDPGVQDAIRVGVSRKRALNHAFGSARTHGFSGTFQHFAASAERPT